MKQKMQKRLWERPKLIVVFRSGAESVLDQCKVSGLSGPVYSRVCFDGVCNDDIPGNCAAFCGTSSCTASCVENGMHLKYRNACSSACGLS